MSERKRSHVTGGEYKATRIFWTLHGLRGVAAYAICLQHYGVPLWEFYHPYIAVDFFFILSGFVIAAAYQPALAKGVSPSRIMRKRFIRLYPLYLLSLTIPLTATGLQVLMGQHHYDISRQLASTAFNIFYLPHPQSVSPYALDYMYSSNPVAWSLACELLVNAVFLFGYRYFVGWRLGAGLVIVGMLLGWFVLMPEKLNHGAEWSYAWVGVLRAFWGFFLGIALYRQFNRRRRFSLVSAPLAFFITLSLVAVMGYGGLRPYYHLIVVYGFLPSLLWVAAHVEVQGIARRIAYFSGHVSYAVYVLHYPMLAFFLLLYAKLGLNPQEPLFVKQYIWPLAVIWVSWLACLYYDTPVRRLLSGRHASFLDVKRHGKGGS